MNKILTAVKERLEFEEKILDDMEIESAPSGEWAEYNIGYIQQEAVVCTWQEAYDLVEEMCENLEGIE
jgi:hypothetical protein